MDILGIDIAKAKFDAALLIGGRVRYAAFPNTESGFEQLLAWLAKQRPDPAAPVHACMEATGNWGLDLAAFLHAAAVPVSIVNPVRIKAYGDSELARNKTDRLDAALIPSVGLPTATPLEPLPTPPASAVPRSRRPGRRLPRTCVNFASWSAAATRLRQPASKSSTDRSPASPQPLSQHPSPPTLPGSTRRSRPSWTQCAASSLPIPCSPAISRCCAPSQVLAKSPPPSCLPSCPTSNREVRQILPSSPRRAWPPSPASRPASTARAPRCAGQARSAASATSACAARSTCAPSAPRTNKALLGFIARLKHAGKPPKVILVAVARKLLIYAHAVVRTQKPFTSSPDAPKPA